MEAKKDKTNKLPLDLIPPESIEGLAKVFEFGATKYGPHNWKKGRNWMDLYGAAMRHLIAFIKGQNKDPESGLSHMYHAMWNCQALAWYEQNNKGNDDRFEKQEFDFESILEDTRKYKQGTDPYDEELTFPDKWPGGNFGGV